jgi:hypothetical protein
MKLRMPALTAIGLAIGVTASQAQVVGTNSPQGASGPMPAATAASSPSGAGSAGTGGSGSSASAEPTFASLSPGNQRIARALFEAQKPADAGGASTAAGGGAAASLESAAWSLDRIAAAKRDGQGWGNVFKEMKAQRLIEAKNLGQVVSASNRQAITEAPGGGTAPATRGGAQAGGSSAVGGGARSATTAAAADTGGRGKASVESGAAGRSPVVITHGNGGTSVVDVGRPGRHGAARTGGSASAAGAGRDAAKGREIPNPHVVNGAGPSRPSGPGHGVRGGQSGGEAAIVGGAAGSAAAGMTHGGGHVPGGSGGLGQGRGHGRHK